MSGQGDVFKCYFIQKNPELFSKLSCMTKVMHQILTSKKHQPSKMFTSENN